MPCKVLYMLTTMTYHLLSVQTNLQRGREPVVLLSEGNDESVNPADVRLEHLHQALYRLLLLHQVRPEPGGVDHCHLRVPRVAGPVA